MHSDGCRLLFVVADLLFTNSRRRRRRLSLFTFTSAYYFDTQSSYTMELPFISGKINDRRHQNGA